MHLLQEQIIVCIESACQFTLNEISLTYKICNEFILYAFRIL